MLSGVYSNISAMAANWFNPERAEHRRIEDPHDYFSEGRKIARTGIVVIATALGGFGVCGAPVLSAIATSGDADSDVLRW